MEKENDILNKIDRKSGFKVPKGYFDNLTNRVMDQLPEQMSVLPQSSSMWDRVKPWVYMAAMFGGMALMVRIFLPGGETETAIAKASSVEISEEEEFFDNNVDEYSVYEYLCLDESVK